MARVPVAPASPPDTFTGTNGTAIGTYSANWVSLNPLDGELEIQSNAFRSQGADAQAMWQGAGAFTANQYAEVRITGAYTNGGDNDRCGVVLRADGNTGSSRNMYYVVYRAATQDLYFYKVTNGSQAELTGGTVSVSYSTGDVLLVEAITNGSNVDLIAYKNGAYATGSAGTSTRTDTTSVFTTGKPGIVARLSVGDMKGDDWTGGNITADGGGGGVIRNRQMMLGMGK